MWTTSVPCTKRTGLARATTRSGTAFEIVDQRSLNGSYVNGERVDRSALVNGAEVRIGKFRLNFFVSPTDLASAEH